MLNRVQVIDALSQLVLFDCSPEDRDQAYLKALEFEDMGIVVDIKAPGLAESLINSLGASSQEIKKFQEELDEENSSHNCESC
jgi:hypothetical protein